MPSVRTCSAVGTRFKVQGKEVKLDEVGRMLWVALPGYAFAHQVLDQSTRYADTSFDETLSRTATLNMQLIGKDLNQIASRMESYWRSSCSCAFRCRSGKHV